MKLTFHLSSLLEAVEGKGGLSSRHSLLAQCRPDAGQHRADIVPAVNACGIFVLATQNWEITGLWLAPSLSHSLVNLSPSQSTDYCQREPGERYWEWEPGERYWAIVDWNPPGRGEIGSAPFTHTQRTGTYRVHFTIIWITTLSKLWDLPHWMYGKSQWHGKLPSCWKWSHELSYCVLVW